MSKKEEKNSIIEICPVRNVVARFGNKWALLVILILNENDPVRFNQLGKLIPDISAKVLSNTLHILEADGLVKRTVFPEVPIKVMYELTETGKTLVPIIISLTDWAQKNMKSIMKLRKQFEE
ncbi:MAG: helix-turn-helix transcriptional regulator [Prevotella sp.]|jgi:DNA-binding HxlR family transcriptional regulator|nr:helix-turn-helix transcriptional regulator [Prevotella sp.]